MATAATAEARRGIIAVGEVFFGDVVAAVLRAPGRTSVPRRGGPLSLGPCVAASDRDMNWPRVSGSGLFL